MSIDIRRFQCSSALGPRVAPHNTLPSQSNSKAYTAYNVVKQDGVCRLGVRCGAFLADRFPIKQFKRLKDDAAIGARLPRLHTIDHHNAGTGLKETADDVEQRGLAAARRAEQRDEVVTTDVEIDTAKRGNGLARRGQIIEVQVAARNLRAGWVYQRRIFYGNAPCRHQRA
jgi:hypothetical protein